MVLFWYVEKYPGILGPLHFFFDQNEDFRHPFDQKRKQAQKLGILAWEMLSPPADAAMKVTPGLQIADMLAWGTNRFATSAAPTGEEGKTYSRLFDFLVSVMPTTGRVWNEDNLRRHHRKLICGPNG